MMIKLKGKKEKEDYRKEESKYVYAYYVVVLVCAAT